MYEYFCILTYEYFCILTYEYFHPDYPNFEKIGGDPMLQFL